MDSDWENLLAVPNFNYAYLFYGNTAIVDASNLKLDAIACGVHSYNNMFNGCTNMTKGPEICMTAQNSVGWSYVFNGNTNFATGNHTLEYMFYNCSSLSEIKLRYKGALGSNLSSNWVSGVAASGTIYYEGPTTDEGVSAIPAGWTVASF